MSSGNAVGSSELRDGGAGRFGVAGVGMTPVDRRAGREQGADETVEFGLDGKTYQFDLASKNASELCEPSRSTSRPSHRRRSRSDAAANSAPAVRALWIGSKPRQSGLGAHGGLKVSDRGRTQLTCSRPTIRRADRRSRG